MLELEFGGDPSKRSASAPWSSINPVESSRSARDGPGLARGKGAVKPGKSYFETCIRPDRHSLELLRGFKNLAENSIDFFATVSWREEAGERKHFLIAATPRPEHPGTILVLHIDLSVLLRGRRELSTLMIGQGPAAFAQMEAAMLGVVRGAIAEALGASNGRGAKSGRHHPRNRRPGHR